VVNPPFPPDFAAKPAAIGFGLTARPLHEPQLLAIAYAFEQATLARRAPVLPAAPWIPCQAGDQAAKTKMARDGANAR
jgi:hypothetical protein